MREVRRILTHYGGACTTAELARAGLGRRDIECAHAAGHLVRVRRGLYADPGMPHPMRRALTIGGRLACASAAELLGLRVLHAPQHLHVARPRNFAGAAAQPTSQVRLHWTDAPGSSARRGIVSVEECLGQMLRCMPALDVLCAFDSALESVPGFGGPPLLDAAGLERVVANASAASRAIIERSSSLSQAVAETVARVRFADIGILARPQVRLAGKFRGDLLIGERLVFEADGEGPHTVPGAFDRDRARAGHLKAIGYTHISYSHHQILNDWPTIESVVRLLMRRGEHLWPSSREFPRPVPR